MNRRPEERGSRPRRRRRSGGGQSGQGGQGAQGGQGGQRGEAQEPKRAAPVLRRYSVVFFENHVQAREDSARLAELKEQCDQLNIVIKAEGTMDDPELLRYGKIFAGEAWHLIHKRRVDDGWYNDPHE